MKVKFRRPLSKTVSALVVAAVVLGGGGYYYKTKIYDKKVLASTKVSTRTTKVKKGNIAVTVSGSGALYFNRSTTLNSKVSSTITKVNFKAGDTVKAGDVIFELDDSDAQNEIINSSSSLTQSYLSSQSAIDDVNNLTVKAPITGQVSNIVVNKGDTVQKGGTLFTITDTSKLKLILPFNSQDVQNLKVGSTVDVNITSSMQRVEGKVTYISNEPTATSNGGKVNSVEILVNNPGAILGGTTATAEFDTANGTISSAGTGTLNYVNKTNVTSLTGGTVESISVKEGQKVSAGQLVVKISNAEVVRAKELADLKNSSSEAQLANTKKKLDNYKIVAPYDGVISELSLRVGDSVKSGDVMATVVDTSQLQFDISIDELDIAKIAVGQKATITLDALEETSTKPLSGEVLKTAFSGNSSNGVTTFPVTVKVNDMLPNLKAGMNANAEIAVSNAENVLYVPIEAVTKVGTKNYVFVQSDAETVASMKKNGTYPNISGGKAFSATQNNSSSGNAGGPPEGGGEPTQGGASGSSGSKSSSSNSSSSSSSRSNFGSSSQSSKRSSASQSQYENAIPVEVELGVYNDTYIEVKSGLKEGEVIILPSTQTSSSGTSTQKSSQGMGGFGGAMGGGLGGGMR